ncbi:putative exostosin [Helianthus annuus]|nr:putative exostosin [Helianthus annuus]
MSAVEYRAILRYRLMIPLFPVDEPCPVCRKACLDSFGEHAIHCKELSGFKYRHDWVRDVLCDVLKRAGISAKKEAPVNFLTDPLEGRSTLRPADILVFGWEGGETRLCRSNWSLPPCRAQGQGLCRRARGAQGRGEQSGKT